MKKLLLLTFQVILLIQLALSDADLCTSQFEDIKNSLCSKLSTDEQTGIKNAVSIILKVISMKIFAQEFNLLQVILKNVK